MSDLLAFLAFRDYLGMLDSKLFIVKMILIVINTLGSPQSNHIRYIVFFAQAFTISFLNIAATIQSWLICALLWISAAKSNTM